MTVQSEYEDGLKEKVIEKITNSISFTLSTYITLLNLKESFEILGEVKEECELLALKIIEGKISLELAMKKLRYKFIKV